MLENSLWNVLAIILAVFLMIVFPIMHSFEKQDQIVRLNVLNETDIFLDAIKAKGYIDKSDFINFKDKLATTGFAFDVKLEHKKMLFVPVYDDPTKEDTFTGDVRVVSELFSDYEIKDVLFGEKAKEYKATYKMSRGDVFTVIVKSKVKSKAQKLKEMLFVLNSDSVFYVKLGGSIQNEAY